MSETAKIPALKIVESSGKSVEFKEIPGILTCLLEHEVKTTKADLQWTGPKIPMTLWNEVLAFFKWTYDTEKSESQVRLFIHPERGWLAWAFPQKGGTSMTTREIDNAEFARQRATCIPDGYVPFGTVHHHCSASAFQSGTDASDEKNQDGLHMTVGNMDKQSYDLHARFYLKGHKFDVDLSAFFELPTEVIQRLAELEEYFGMVAPINGVVRRFCCKQPPADTPINEQWKANYIVERPVVIAHSITVGGNGKRWCSSCSRMADHDYRECPELKKRSQGMDDWKVETLLKSYLKECSDEGISNVNAMGILSTLLAEDMDSRAMKIFVREMSDWNAPDIERVMQYLDEHYDSESDELLEQAEKEDAKANGREDKTAKATEPVSGWEDYGYGA